MWIGIGIKSFRSLVGIWTIAAVHCNQRILCYFHINGPNVNSSSLLLCSIYFIFFLCSCIGNLDGSILQTIKLLHYNSRSANAIKWTGSIFELEMKSNHFATWDIRTHTNVDIVIVWSMHTQTYEKKENKRKTSSEWNPSN